jgi:hypothetical protein
MPADLPPSMSSENSIEWATRFIQDNSKEDGTGGETLDDSHF